MTSDDITPLDSTRQAFDAWIAARPGTAEYERARAVALATAISKFHKANVRMARQLPAPVQQTEAWQPLATRHLASALMGDLELWRTLNYEQAKQIVSQHGFSFEPNPDA
jgi:hypothetical protein